jgi:hypothetical protein
MEVHYGALTVQSSRLLEMFPIIIKTERAMNALHMQRRLCLWQHFPITPLLTLFMNGASFLLLRSIIEQ